jgi:lactate dehydrogenase-like 2-hydroxyacid dehydrogenase
VCKPTRVGIVEICLTVREAFYLVQTIGYKTDKQDVSRITKKVILVTDHSLMVQEQTADILMMAMQHLFNDES